MVKLYIYGEALDIRPSIVEAIDNLTQSNAKASCTHDHHHHHINRFLENNSERPLSRVTHTHKSSLH